MFNYRIVVKRQEEKLLDFHSLFKLNNTPFKKSIQTLSFKLELERLLGLIVINNSRIIGG